MDTVFYSWQSDLDEKTNRFFIVDALEKAVKLLKRGGFEVAPRIDQDARDCPGAADIATEIFKKIRACRVFVADVSIINAGAVFPGSGFWVGEERTEEKPCRPTPNPNVMIELGYAAHALTWDRVICVVNEAYGEVEKLPFDIRPRAMVRFSLLPTAEEGERTQKKEALRDHLRGYLKVAIDRNEAEIAEQQRKEKEEEERERAADEARRQGNTTRNLLRHQLAQFLERFKVLMQRADAGVSIPVGEFSSLEVEADNYLTQHLPEYRKFNSEYQVIRSFSNDAVLAPDEARQRCQARIGRLQEVLGLL
jgi:hypothetical protein